jgi:hypothetical protein
MVADQLRICPVQHLGRRILFTRFVTLVFLWRSKRTLVGARRTILSVGNVGRSRLLQ